MGVHWTQFCPKGHDTLIVGRHKSHCKACKKAYHKEYHKTYYAERGAEFYRDKGWRKYGIRNESGEPFTRVDFDRFYQKQSGSCRICKKHQSSMTKTLAVDHDHLTGIVRGLLCLTCNNGLGVYEKKRILFAAYLGEKAGM